MWEELENGLAWFKAAPATWVTSAKQDMSAAADWIWVVLQGDFADEQSTGQIVTSTVISMIPFVDQLCDVRDVVANCRKLNQDSNNKLAWLALALTLVGLIPVLGSFAKGCMKILFGYARKAVVNGAVKSLDSAVWLATRPFVEAGIVKLNQHLASPGVRRALVALKIDNVYKHLALKTKRLKAATTPASLTTAFDVVITTLNQMAELMNRWGSTALQTRVGAMLRSVEAVRAKANQKLAEVLQPLHELLDRIARRLEIEADMTYRANTNVVNPHNFNQTRLNADMEQAALAGKKEPWVDVARRPKYSPVDISLLSERGKINAAVSRGWTDPIVGKQRPRDPMANAHATFHTLDAVEIPPGTTLYRIVDPSSSDNSICWMSKAEFDQLQSKDDWRRRFAVWKHWNSNGEYVTYVVPPGKPLKVWEGVTASQQLQEKSQFFLAGGARQIVIEPSDLDKAYMGKRQATGWGFSDGMTREPDFTGLPSLINNWRE
ncbi:hypothetical protein [Aquabacterium sp.]|jgi:hypothetical protein|uniref:hypothetical protein n=1 Tax=Aquabacterium sp. TaxID=1872578 RepID=UPI0027BAF57D|nr:hypothetical protein [Aquabacterium sp.]